MDTPLLWLDGLTVRYGGITALREVNLHVHQGELVALLGSNGAGKSTTLRAISQLVPAAAGSIRWHGGPINGIAPERTVKLGIGHCPEGRRVLASQSVAANLELGAWLRRDQAAVAADLERCYGLFPRLAERRQQLAGSLSGGEQQMLAIARALCLEPEVLLLDEPTEGLQPSMIALIRDTVIRLREKGMTTILVEQRVDAVLRMSDRVAFMAHGRVEAEVATSELTSKSPQFQQFVGV